MLGTEKKIRALYGDAVGSQAGNPAVEAKETANSARAGLAIALLAVVMALGVYVALDAKISSLSQSVADLPAKVASLDMKVAAFENLPTKVRKQMVADRLAEMASTAQRLSAGLDTDDQKAVMAKISDMAKQLQSDLSQ
jgi:outer membrane murein-binding lipoprotein Lpp